MLFDSPFRRLQREGARFARRGMGLTEAMHRPLVFGTRAIRWPGIAFHVRIDMGPARHALSQMVVAGHVAFVHPFPPPPRTGGSSQ